MSKVGPFVTVRNGAYCQINLDSGEKILVRHDRDRSRGERLTVERLRVLGFSSETIFRLDLNSAEGRAALAALVNDSTGRVAATPLGALVAYVRECASSAQVIERCWRLLKQP